MKIAAPQIIYTWSSQSLSLRTHRAILFAGKILIVTAGVSDQEAIQLVQAGIAGILHKRHSTNVPCETIREIANSQMCLEEEYLAPLFRFVDRSRTPDRPKLTEREQMMLRLIFQGLSNRDIGEPLEISEAAAAALRKIESANPCPIGRESQKFPPKNRPCSWLYCSTGKNGT